jgi:hypothetical protein
MIRILYSEKIQKNTLELIPFKMKKQLCIIKE